MRCGARRPRWDLGLLRLCLLHDRDAPVGCALSWLRCAVKEALPPAPLPLPSAPAVLGATADADPSPPAFLLSSSCPPAQMMTCSCGGASCPRPQWRCRRLACASPAGVTLLSTRAPAQQQILTAVMAPCPASSPRDTACCWAAAWRAVEGRCWPTAAVAALPTVAAAWQGGGSMRGRCAALPTWQQQLRPTAAAAAPAFAPLTSLGQSGSAPCLFHFSQAAARAAAAMGEVPVNSCGFWRCRLTLSSHPTPPATLCCTG